VCNVLDTDDERVRCISDYRASRVTGEELEQCIARELQLAEVSAYAEATDRECLCDGDESDCPGNDDESASR